jgi:hypothetical protein
MKLKQFKTPGGLEHVVTETYIAIGRVVLCELGCSSEFPRRSAACGWFEQHWTELNPRFAGDPASEHRHPAGQYCYSTGRNRDSASNPGANNPWLRFAQWDSEHNRAGVDLTEHSHPRKQHAAFNRQSQHNQSSWHFAQRFALWHLARHGKRSFRLHAQHRIEFESVDPWKPGQ